ncbi:MAG: hypothetical protein ACFFAJ_03950 [Candidatus Hodarchaeota archaeon]
MSKDKIYGYGIFGLTLIFLLLYIIFLPVQYYFANPGTLSGILDLSELFTNLPITINWEDAVLWPVFLATLMIGFIIAWIGITMATTPPPEPIDLDDLNLDDEEFEEEEEEEKED